MFSDDLLEAAWLATLNHSEWAESLRQRLRLGQHDLSDLLHQGPWETHPQTPEHAWQFLTPSHEFARNWQNQHAARGPVFVPLAQVDPWLWRGPQPDLATLQSLQQQGLTTVFNLRPECDDSLGFCRDLGLEYRHYEVRDMSVPELGQVADFLDYFRGGGGPALVHCFAGQGRTGLFAAAYRIFRGLSAQEAIDVTNQESQRKGMRPCQARWILQHAEQLTCIPSK